MIVRSMLTVHFRVGVGVRARVRVRAPCNEISRYGIMYRRLGRHEIDIGMR